MRPCLHRTLETAAEMLLNMRDHLYIRQSRKVETSVLEDIIVLLNSPLQIPCCCIQLRYTGVQAQCSHMLFPQPLPATNIRMLAATPTVRQDAGAFCPVLSSHREACLEASCQLAAFLWQ